MVGLSQSWHRYERSDRTLRTGLLALLLGARPLRAKVFALEESVNICRLVVVVVGVIIPDVVAQGRHFKLAVKCRLDADCTYLREYDYLIATLQ